MLGITWGNRLVATAVLFGTVGTLAAAHATPVTLTGNYVQVGISDYGTFGSDGSTEPGILHDPTGKGNFYPGGIPNDYLTPGIPHDGFAINSTQTGLLINDNNGSSALGYGSPTVTSNGTTQAATWTGSPFAGLTITNTYSFNVNSEKIAITTTITNSTGAALTGLYFGRSEDPDPDVYRYGSYLTYNVRGDKSTAPNDLVSGAGAYTGLTIGILNTSTTYTSNTDISYNCCNNNDPALVFNGTDPSGDYSANYNSALANNGADYGDYGLQMAWNLGTLADGSSATIDYAYVLGTNQGTVSTPTVPLPASLPMFGGALLAVAGLGFGMRRRAAV